MVRAALFALLCASSVAAAELKVTSNLPSDRWLAAREPVALQLSRPLTPEDGAVAVFIGNLDVTALFDRTGESLSYRENTLPLPAGERELIVYRVPSGGAAWEEIGRFPIKVLTTRGFRKAAIQPSLDLTNKGQLDKKENPVDSISSRGHFQDLTLQGGLSGEIERGDFTLRSRTNFNGASYIREALRFGEKGDAAPRVDLSSYVLEIQKGMTSLALGHVSVGTQRHLINGFASRGAALTFGVGKPISIQFAALNGTSIVGWDNIAGVANRNHRMLATTLGLELVPSRQGALRLEASLLDGSLLPFNAFTQGAILSAERSRGEAMRVLVSSPGQRVVIDAGVTRSRFRAQRDQQLEDGLNVVPLTEKQRRAEYIDATFALVQNRNIGKGQQASVSIVLNFDRVEPLFRSVAVSTQPDIQRGAVSLSGSLGPLTWQVAHIQMEDNLDDIRSILKTKTRQNTANLGLALAPLFGAKRGVRWIPVLTSTLSQTHQFGAYLPIDSGFSDSHVPNQMSVNAQSGIEWQVQPFRFGFRTSLSQQDNRQTGRERSDFQSGSGTIFVALALSDRFDVGLETSRESQKNVEFAQRDRTSRNGVTLSWKAFRDIALATNYSKTNGRNDPRTNDRSATESFLELSSGFRFRPKPGEQGRNRLFVRYSNRDSSTTDRIFNVQTAMDGWAVTSGINLSVF